MIDVRQNKVVSPWIVHFTTVHTRADARIAVKQVKTLAGEYPGRVQLFVRDGLGDDWNDAGGFQIHDVGQPDSSRWRRMTLGAWQMFNAVRRVRPKVAHFHDPELLPWAVLLKIFGIRIIYDVHEDLPRQVLHKGYLPARLRKFVSFGVSMIERLLACPLDGVVIVSKAVAHRFRPARTVEVRHFPTRAEYDVPAHTETRPSDRTQFIYVGGLTAVRGLWTMLDAVALLERDDVLLRLFGNTASGEENARLNEMALSRKVDFAGWGDRATIWAALKSSDAGLAILHPTPQYVDAYPVKLFEYMAAGLPFIASDFPHLREIVEKDDCGLLVDPENPHSVAKAMRWIVDNPEEASAMGRRGRVAIGKTYNWDLEAEKLILLYHRLLGVGESKMAD